ncbi:MAG: FlgD immunoglobulin-like domain containing protein, partial [Candidatus Thorarchaeota archaeon]
PGFEIDQYTWSITSGNAQIVGGQGTPNVTVRVYDQSFTLQCYIVDFHGDVTCDGTFTYPVIVHPNPDCEIMGEFALCLDDFGASQDYSLGNCPDFVIVNDSCDWTLVGTNTAGAMITDDTDCVATVTVAQAGEFTLHVEYVDENDCPGVAEQTVVVYPEPDCDLDGVTEICLDDATDLEYSLINCDDFDIVDCDYSFTANTAGATLDDVTDCVATVSASQDGYFTLHVEYVDDNGCDGTADLTVTIDPEPECEITGTTAICLDYATDLIYQIGDCPGFVVDPTTCNWWLTDNTAGASIDDVTDCVATVSASQDGSFIIHVSYEDENGCDGETQLTVTIYPEPDCEIQGIDEICFIDLDTLEYSLGNCPDFVIDPTTCNWWLTDNTAGATIDDVTDCVATVSASQDGDFTIHVSYEDENGCDGEDSYTVTIYPQPPCMIDAPDDVCFGDLPIEICGPEPPAPGAYRYEWSIGVPTVGGKGPSDISSSLEDENRVEEHCYEFDPPVPGDYLVSQTVFDLQSDLECWTQCDTNIRVGDAPTCFIDTLDQRPECGSEENELAADITPPDVTPDYMSYQWKLVEGADCGWEITDGADTDTVIFTAGDGEDCCGLFRLIVTAHYGDVACADSCEVEQCCRPIYDEFCSFTKGYYGNAGGYKFGGMTTAEIIQAAIPTSDPLVLGVLGVRSLTIPDTSALCIIDRLPGGGPSGPLPDFGDEVLLASTCLASIDPGEDQLPLQHNGQFRNNFLTQVIALSLNTRLWWVHPDIAGHLGDAPICPYMQTLGAMCGDDGICGSVDDVAVLEDCKNFGIDMAVLEAIDTEFGGGNRDVEHLLMLANRALAELSTGGATLGQIHDAVTAINEGFDECRFLNHCGDDPADCPEFIPKGAMIVLPDGDGSLSKPIVPDAFALSPNAPNPVKTGTSIKYALPEESQVRLTIYNVKGQVVDTLEDGVKPAGYHTAYWHSGSRSEVSAGVYFLRMQAVGNETGETFSMTQKMVVVR